MATVTPKASVLNTMLETAKDGAKTAASAEAADRIRKVLMARLGNTPIGPIVEWIPDHVLNYLLSTAVLTAARNFEAMPARKQIEAVSQLAMEGSAHNAVTTLMKEFLPLLGELKGIAQDLNVDVDGKSAE